MTPERMAELFGKQILLTDSRVVYAKEDDKGLHLYVFRVKDGMIQLPNGFIRGHSSLLHE